MQSEATVTDTACARMLKMLFADLRAEMSQGAGRERLIRDHGVETCERLWRVVSALSSDAPAAEMGIRPAAAHGQDREIAGSPTQTGV